MKTYARIDNGSVVEIIEPAIYQTPDPSIVELSGESVYESLLAKVGEEIPIGDRFTTPFVSTLVDITDIEPKPQVGWAYNGTVFSESA